MKIRTLLLGAAALALTISSASAQTWPSRPLTWIVPFAVGGPTDALARSIAEQVAREIGQPIVVDNAPGAGGTVGATKAARAKPDGYTMLVGHMGYMGFFGSRRFGFPLALLFFLRRYRGYRLIVRRLRCRFCFRQLLQLRLAGRQELIGKS